MTACKDPEREKEHRRKLSEAHKKLPCHWADEEAALLKVLINEYKTYKEISIILTRTPRAISAKAQELGLKSKVNEPGINNVHFKDTLVGYTGLHEWVRKYKPAPLSCEKCGKSGTLLEARNISGNYTRDLEDWEYLCVTCHRRIDGTRGGLKPKLSYGPNKKLLFHHQRKSL